MTHPLKGRKQTPAAIAARVAARRANGTYTFTDEWRANLSAAHMGKKMPEAQKQKIAAARKGQQNCLGHKPSIEHRKKLSDYWAANRERHNHYVDGRGIDRKSARMVEMGRLGYRLWREAVFRRDDWTCVECGVRGVKLHADHIKPYCAHPELRLDPDNGQTLCVPCHRKTPTFGSRAKAFQMEAA